MKIVINTCYGGFHPSEKAILHWAKLSGMELHLVTLTDGENRWKKGLFPIFKELTLEEAEKKWYSILYSTKAPDADGKLDLECIWNYSKEVKDLRTDPFFIQTVEELGEEVNSRVSQLKVIEIPDDVDWVIQEEHGEEWVAEKHRTWD